ncbi:MAG: hypothetical protein A2086_02975 [Spirochaetes bacterium GWD1_27_9]|nr:MAG: hypothetical protein A2Z98_07200 [Spirochaetes bacterium GWB1_27_13]OHD26438.1 MAG: hypothetical protein A2Y34_10035 [Spirochaetes bacterium GWC1_27_15]OHD45130.1 MAG: hypothetical protein A2086_02975 [Spirochaetes bacterium GWD1_27_9]
MGNEVKKETNLAYGGQALIEGIMMRGKEGYAFTIKKQDGTFHKEKHDYVALGKRIKFFGLPFIRGISGFFENMFIGIKVLNKSAEIAFPEENNQKTSNFTMFVTFGLAMVIAMGIFVALPYFLTQVFGIVHNKEPFMYNLIAGVIRMLFFFMYLILISFMKDTKRLFGYHGAEHKTIHTYESDKDLTVENVKTYSRLHPRCGTSFLFIVFLITIVVFPFINEFFIRQTWYQLLSNYGKIGDALQKLVIIASHILIGMPIVSSISYEILKLSGKFYKNFLVKIFIAPGLFFQLFTTREPEEDMIKVGIISLNMVLGKEDADVPRAVSDTDILPKKASVVLSTLLFLPFLFLNFLFDFNEE